MKFLEIHTEGIAYREEVIDLYKEAFPEEEQKSWKVLEALYEEHKMEILAIIEDNAGNEDTQKNDMKIEDAENKCTEIEDAENKCTEIEDAGKENFVGLAINMLNGNQALLDYFAIAADKREQGYGSQAIRLLQERFEGKAYILEIELPLPDAENAKERIRRKAFYLRNGLKETKVYANVYHTDFELLTPTGELTYAEYFSFLCNTLGEEYIKFLQPKELTDIKVN